MSQKTGECRKFEDYHKELCSFFAKGHFDVFKSLQSVEERILYVANLPTCPTYPIRTRINNSKNFEEAKIMKNRGNMEFQQQNYDNAFSFYSQALLKSSSIFAEFSELLPVLYANRSAASYYLKNYDNAIKDVDVALKNGYPAQLCYKLLIRKVKCLIALQKYEEASVISKLLENALNEADLSITQKQKLEDDIHTILSVKFDTTCQNIEEGLNQNIWSNEKRNSKYEALIAGVEIKFSQEMGRFAEANVEIEAGRIILQEDAHCAVLLKSYCSSCCYNCFRRVQALYPCPSCSEVIFCSEECANLAISTYHGIECPILETLWESNLSVTCLMALRVISQQKLEYFKARKNTFRDSELIPSHKYSSRDYESAYNLVNHEEKRKPEDILNRIYIALFLMRCLKHTSYFIDRAKMDNNESNKFSNQELTLEDDEFYVTRLLLHHLQILQFNAHEISELQIQYTKDVSFCSEFIGGGLYPTLALFNHSCCPTIVRFFDGTKVIARAVRTIRAGEMVTENYGPVFTDMPKKKRQFILRERYWFTCTCPACIYDWPTLKEMNEMNYLPLRCNHQSCNAKILIDPAQSNFLVKCGTCLKTKNSLKSLKMLQEIDLKLKDSEKLLKSKKINEATSQFLWILKQLEQVFILPVKEYSISQQHLQTCYLMEGNKSEKYKNE